MKKIVSIIIAIAIFATIGTLVAFAATYYDRESATLNGGEQSVSAVSSVGDNNGIGQTVMSIFTIDPNEIAQCNPNVTVSVTYDYVDTSTSPVTPYVINKTSSGATNAYAGGSKPVGSTFRSYRTKSTHTARAEDQNWNTVTEVFYAG